MCGRFVSASPPDELARYFGAEAADQIIEPSYNVAPTNDVYVVRRASNAAGTDIRELTALRWGLVPFWAKDLKIGSKMINARAETILEKPAFKKSFSRRRCLVPADGFYEWAKVQGEKAKQPYLIQRADGEPLVLAGIWERWSERNDDGSRDESSQPIETFTILTCAPNATMAPIHNRMPVLLAPKVWDDWLASETAEDFLVSLLKPAPDDLLTTHPVSTAVNRVVNNSPELIRPESISSDEGSADG